MKSFKSNTLFIGIFFGVKMVAVVFAAAAFFSSCYKKEAYCDLWTFAAVSCEPGVCDVTKRHKSDYKIDRETCLEMEARMRAERTEVFYWYGNEISIEELIYCDCK